MGNTGESGVYPVDKSRKQPGMEPDRLFRDSGGRINARIPGARDPDAGHLWDKATERVGRGWLEGPSPHDQNGQLLASEGPEWVQPAGRFGAH